MKAYKTTVWGKTNTPSKWRIAKQSVFIYADYNTVCKISIILFL